ncbi:hypothetical protein O0I10_008128 [Lichtheimia ornata]|uniref:Beta-lactamase-related domain-containing protein n=1 Tax=Lichtheimia ornata TaxID=688661 RepID=A0AAD7V0R3_9FUNG|nr:uncharacterized protein O0I10_008128 [Lichtheimia ornata]KAJ8656115.1 hypothetical protein O0I10_008128 [Lichtheimia ornata]
MKRSKLLSHGQHAILLSSALLAGAAFRIFSRGPFTPLSCSLFNTGCLPEPPIQVLHVDNDYAHVLDLFKDNIERGDDIGAGVAAYVNGQLVVDVRGGWQDVAKGTPYTDNTLNMVYSSTKMLSAITVAHIVDKGALSYDEKIATYWPEFAQGNKENVTVGDLMQHVAGVPFLDRPITSAEMEDSERFSNILASQRHIFDGERKRSYHAIVGGWYINEVLKRAANETVDSVAAKFNDAYDIEWRLKPYQQEYDDRIAHFYTLPWYHQLYHHLVGGMETVKTFWEAYTDEYQILVNTGAQIGPDSAGPDRITSLRYRRLEGPAYSGFTNARSVAKLAAMMANGGKAIVPGEPDLLSAQTYALASEPMEAEYDMCIRMPIRSTRGGFAVFDHMKIGGLEFTGWTGYSGSLFLWNEEYKVGFGYVPNAVHLDMPPDRRSLRLLEAIASQAKASRIST